MSITPPQVGDIICEGNGISSHGLRVTKATEKDGLWYFKFIPVPPCPWTVSHNTGYLNRYVIDGERIRSLHPWPPGSTGYSYNGGGRDGDGYDEIIIMERAAQKTLF